MDNFIWKPYINKTILEKGIMNNINYAIVRGPYSLCIYVGICWDDKLSSLDYEDVPIYCVPGGFTYKSDKSNNDLPADLCWFGWDYAHYNNYNNIDDIYFKNTLNDGTVADITVKKIKNDIWNVTYDLAQLLSKDEIDLWPKKCSYCGRMNRKSVLVCEGCGAPIENDNSVIWDC